MMKPKPKPKTTLGASTTIQIEDELVSDEEELAEIRAEDAAIDRAWEKHYRDLAEKGATEKCASEKQT